MENNVEIIIDEILDLRCNRKLCEAYNLSLQLLQQHSDLFIFSIAGELAVEIDEFNSAIDLFTRLIQESLAKNDSWYLSTAYLLRAFSYTKIGKYEKALKDINERFVDIDNDVFWLQNHDSITIDKVKSLIKK